MSASCAGPSSIVMASLIDDRSGTSATTSVIAVIGTAATSSHVSRRRQRAERLVTPLSTIARGAGDCEGPCPRLLEIATLHGLARAHLRLTEDARGALVLGHGAGGGVSAPDLVAARELLHAGFSVVARRAAVPRRRPALARTGAAARRGVDGGRAQLGDGPLARTAARDGRPLVGRARRVPHRGGDGAAGVLCLAFPVHPPGRPEKSRLDELDAVAVPVLVVQGERDPFGMPPPASGTHCRGVAGDHGLKADHAALEAAVSAWLEGGWLSSAGGNRRRARASRGDRSPTELVAAKVADRLNHLTRQFVERSPFVCVATSRPDGGLDVSPRGDPAGFVRILDERTLLLPDRPGNKLADTLTNLLADPRIGLLFLIPGVGDSFRVNGRARIVDDSDLLAESTVEGKAPKLGILVEIEEAFTQCSKALVRSDLWNPDNHVERSELPSSGAILASTADPDLDVEEYERARAERYARREGFY